MLYEKKESHEPWIRQVNDLQDPNFFKRIESDRVMASFLEISENRSLVSAVLALPTAQNIRKLDKAFKEFYAEIKFIKYVSMILYYEAIHFNQKRVELQQKAIPFDHTREPNEEHGSESNILEDTDQELSNSLAEQIADQELYQAFQALTVRQQQVLQLAYAEHLTDREIASVFGVSQQAISASRRSALSKLKQALTAEKAK